MFTYGAIPCYTLLVVHARKEEEECHIAPYSYFQAYYLDYFNALTARVHGVDGFPGCQSPWVGQFLSDPWVCNCSIHVVVMPSQKKHYKDALNLDV